MTLAKTQRTPSKNNIANSKLEIRNSKQKGKTQNTNFKTFKNAGEVLIGRFWILRIEILKLFRISIFDIRYSNLNLILFGISCFGFRIFT